MKALTTTNESMRRELLLEITEKMPGDRIGIRMGAMFSPLVRVEMIPDCQTVWSNSLERREIDPIGKR